MTTAIHWFRRDLRIADNTALAAAVAAHDHVVPVCIVSEWQREHHWCGAPRQEFLCGCLASLAKNLEARGGRLIVRRGRADAVLETLARETKADAISFNRDPDPFGRVMEQRVESAARKLGIRIHACQDIALHERDEVLTGSHTPFKIFTPYARAWLKLDKPAPGRTLGKISTPPDLKSDPLPTLQTWGLKSNVTIIEPGEAGAVAALCERRKSNVTIIEPGEAAARKRLGRFLDGPIFAYEQGRDLPAQDRTSRLSQDLRHGTLSIREVYAKCAAAAEKGTPAERHSAGVFINELIWREFFMQVLWHWPEVLDREFQKDCRHLPWRDHWRPEKKPGGEAFARWCRGETGFPIVDAGMRQLAATGFMHNRVRMIAATFLTKDLHIWWMHGESWFMQRLVDGEIASNNGGWQWSASTGTDAAPWFRIQNPWSQTKRYDPEGAYIRRWVPELRDVPAVKFCQPPATGEPLAGGYPRPMVDHAQEREAALEMFHRRRPVDSPAAKGCD